MERIEDDKVVKYQMTKKDQRKRSYVKRMLLKFNFYIGVGLFFCTVPLVSGSYELIPFVFLGTMILFLPNIYFDYKNESFQIIEAEIPKSTKKAYLKILDKEQVISAEIPIGKTNFKLFESYLGLDKKFPLWLVIENENLFLKQEKSNFWSGKSLKKFYYDLEETKSRIQKNNKIIA